MNRGKELAKNTIIIAFGKICTYFSTFLLIPLLTSRLSTEDYGIVDLISSYIVLLAPNLALQQELAVFRFLVDCRKESSEKKISVLSSSLFAVVKIAFTISIIAYLFLVILGVKYRLLIVLNTIVLMFSGFFLQVSRGLGKNIVFSIGSALAGVINILLCVFVLVILNAGVNGVLISSALANGICIVYLFFALKLGRLIKKSCIDKKMERKLIKYSVPLIPNSLSWWAINTSDRTIISALISVSANGIYAVACKFPSIITSLYSIFGLSLMESASVHVDDKDKDSYFTNILGSSFKLFSSISMSIVALMPFIFPILVDSDYSEAYVYVPVIVIGSFLNCVVGTYSAILFAKKMTKKIMNTSIVSAAINLVVDLVLIKFVGIYAAAISTIVAYLVMIVYRHIEIRRYIKIRLNPKLIVVTLIMYSAICLSYYKNDTIINVITLMLTAGYCLYMNKKIVKTLLSFKRKKKE